MGQAEGRAESRLVSSQCTGTGSWVQIQALIRRRAFDAAVKCRFVHPRPTLSNISIYVFFIYSLLPCQEASVSTQPLETLRLNKGASPLWSISQVNLICSGVSEKNLHRIYEGTYRYKNSTLDRCCGQTCVKLPKETLG